MNLILKNVNKTYGKKTVLNDINMQTDEGEIIGLIGPNGAGKTTLLSILTGLLKQRHGEVRLDGKKLTPRQRRSLSYLVMQDTDYQLFASSVEEELSLGMKDDCKEKVDETLKALELSDYRERHPASLSGGQKQRVTIGAAIVKGSPVIYFDEPTSGLDYRHMLDVAEAIREMKKADNTQFIITHDAELVSHCCDYIILMQSGKIIKQGSLMNQDINKAVREFWKQ